MCRARQCGRPGGTDTEQKLPGSLPLSYCLSMLVTLEICLFLSLMAFAEGMASGSGFHDEGVCKPRMHHSPDGLHAQATAIGQISSIVHIAATWQQLPPDPPQGRVPQSRAPQSRLPQPWMRPLLHALSACLQAPPASLGGSPLEQAMLELLADAFLQLPQAPGDQGLHGHAAALPEARVKLLHFVLATFVRRWLER